MYTVKNTQVKNIFCDYIKERRKIYAARDFSGKYDFALFKYLIKFMKLFIISLKRLIKF